MQTKIQETEWKVGKESGRKYLRVKTDKGWMSCFDDAVVADVQKNIGNIVELEISETESGFKNIQKVKAVVERIGTPEKQEKPLNDDKPSYYVSYAKDICCVLLEKTENSELTTENTAKIMDMSIALVKKAREAFS